jgi:DNA (cytosine-5)-methyltransferase 1
MRKSEGIPVIDLFAGPGGLGEGFASLRDSRGRSCFRIALSVEKDAYAHRTLELRAFYRKFVPSAAPQEYYEHLQGKLSREALFAAYPEQAQAAVVEARLAELGAGSDQAIHKAIRQALGDAEPWVLVGGPPCQAYSVAGRARNKGVNGYHPDRDSRQTLYVEYLKVIAKFWPAVFIMENVKGLLSAKLDGERVFDRILGDLAEPGRALSNTGTASSRAPEHTYRVFSLSPHGKLSAWDPDDYIVKAELHGIPQSRHRIFLFGIRGDICHYGPSALAIKNAVHVRQVLRGLPRLRSGLSRIEDSGENWLSTLKDAKERRWMRSALRLGGKATYELLQQTLESLRAPRAHRGGEFVPFEVDVEYEREWFVDERLGGVCNHSTKAHMESDLHRYLYAACFAKAQGDFPRLRDLPADLMPRHSNAPEAARIGYGIFQDRFRVQVANAPASTVTSHIHKDGHYYIHPDPAQCRSLTVREAARLQTFPDNYFFCGPRTEQYKQVGNAVPPLLARDIAMISWQLLGS